MKQCVCCGKDTTGHVGNDIVCLACYKTHRYKWYLENKKAKEWAKNYG